MGLDEMMEDYKNFLRTFTFPSRGALLPRLLSEYQHGSSLAAQFTEMDANGGYAFLTQPRDYPSNPYEGCELLFLRVEDGDKWPNILHSFFPGNDYVKGIGRNEQCPGMARHIEMLTKYELTPDEKSGIRERGEEFVGDWFDVYRYDYLSRMEEPY